MYRWTRELRLPAAVERILEATGWLAAAVAASPGGAEAGHLLHAVDRVRRVTEAGGTLADAAEALEEDLESTEVESVPLEPGRRDVVRLMNLHKAKGLEAAVVFLADPARAGSRSGPTCGSSAGPAAREATSGSAPPRAAGHQRPRRAGGLGRARGGRARLRPGRAPAPALRRRHAGQGPARDRAGGPDRRQAAALGAVRAIPRGRAAAPRCRGAVPPRPGASRLTLRAPRGGRRGPRGPARGAPPAVLAGRVRHRTAHRAGPAAARSRPAAPASPTPAWPGARSSTRCSSTPCAARARPGAPRARRPLAHLRQRRAPPRGPRGARHRRARDGLRPLAARARGRGAPRRGALRRARGRAADAARRPPRRHRPRLPGADGWD